MQSSSVSDLVHRIARLPLCLHAGALLGLLILLLPLVGPFGSVSVDEGAVAHQAAVLADGDGWSFDSPLPVIPEDVLVFPIGKSERTSEGWATFVRHPLYASVSGLVMRVVGSVGLVALSMLGLVLAAWGAGAVGARLAGGWVPVVALWSTALGTPLLFDGYFLIAHSLGAAVAAWACWLWLGLLEHPAGHSRQTLFLSGLLALAIAVGVLLRTEIILVAGAMSAVAVGWSIRRRIQSGMLVVAPLVIGVGAALIVEEQWRAALGARQQLIGGPSGRTIEDPGGWLGSRWDGLVASVLSVGPARLAPLLGLAAVLLVCAALLIRVDVARWAVLPVCALAIACVALPAVDGPALVPGLIVTCPLLVVIPALVVGRGGVRMAAALAGAVAGLAAVAVVMFQYEDGGSVEWGGRYFAVVLPIAVPVLVTAVDAMRPRGRDALGIIAALVVCSLLLGAASIAAIGDVNRRADAVLERVGELSVPTRLTSAPDDLRPVVITSHFGIARLDWRRYDERRWLYLGPDDATRKSPDPQVAILRQDLTGDRVVTLVTEDRERDLERIGRYQIVEDRGRAGTFAILILRL